MTPTGAALLNVFGATPPPVTFTPELSGYGAGTKEFSGRPNALRLIIAREEPARNPATEAIVVLAADIDDMSPEHLAAAVDELRDLGALDVVTLPTHMKKGRAGVRIELISRPEDAARLSAERV